MRSANRAAVRNQIQSLRAADDLLSRRGREFQSHALKTNSLSRSVRAMHNLDAIRTSSGRAVELKRSAKAAYLLFDNHHDAV